jgi:integrase
MSKKPKTPAGEPKVKTSNNRLQIVLTYRGARKYLSLGLPDSKSNRTYAEMVKMRIMSDLLIDNFDPTLDRYKREALRPAPDVIEIEDISISKLWEKFTDYKRPQLSQTTIAKDYNRVRCNIAKFPSDSVGDAISIRDYLVNTTSPNTAKRVLSKLAAVCDWGVSSRLVSTNPFAGMSADIKIGKKGDDAIQAFTTGERDRIIQAFRKKGSHYATLIEFLFRTGCRPSEAVALQVKHLGADYRSITFCQAITPSENGLKLKQNLKTQSKRIFPCGDAMAAFLESIVGDDTSPDRFLFLTPTEKHINIDKINPEWKAVLKDAGIPVRGIYHCRHT